MPSETFDTDQALRILKYKCIKKQAIHDAMHCSAYKFRALLQRGLTGKDLQRFKRYCADEMTTDEFRRCCGD